MSVTSCRAHGPAAVIAIVALGCVALATACGGDTNKPPSAEAQAPLTATPRAIPPPVVYQAEPQGIELDDPSFDALPGATAEFGRIGGSAYQIEVPDDWNGRLVLYMHGFQGLAPKGHVEAPGLRTYLIRHGIAWGAASFSSTALIPGRAADETAALWDRFVVAHGRPARTYITGESMGGAATEIAAERYADRYDGALALCGYAGQSAQSDIVGDFFFAGAYVAGLTQAEFDATPDVAQLIGARILPALTDPAKHKMFEDILIDITGGPRAFDRQGFRAEEATNWQRAAILVSARLSYNDARTYQLRASSGVSSGDFNRGVIRVAPDTARVKAFTVGNEITGDLQMPVLTLHTTGDWQVPIDEEQLLRRKVDAAGKGDMLVQRAVQASPHCGFTDSEWERGLEDVMAWVEKGTKPAGENLLVDDLSSAGTQYTLAPRLGSVAADAVAGASDRIIVSGTVMLDGKPLDGGFLWIEVERDGLRATCSFPGESVEVGRYARTVAGDEEVRGCGRPGSRVYVVTYRDGKVLYSQAAVWQASGRTLQLDAVFTTTGGSTSPAGTRVLGRVLDGEGAPASPGAVIEGYVGDTRCGVASIARAVMMFGDTDGFTMIVAGPDTVPGCATGATIDFRVSGQPATGTTVNTLRARNPPVTLIAAP